MTIVEAISKHSADLSSILQKYCDDNKIPLDYLIYILKYLQVQYETALADYAITLQEMTKRNQT